MPPSENFIRENEQYTGTLISDLGATTERVLDSRRHSHTCTVCHKPYPCPEVVCGLPASGEIYVCGNCAELV